MLYIAVFSLIGAVASGIWCFWLVKKADSMILEADIQPVTTLYDVALIVGLLAIVLFFIFALSAYSAYMMSDKKREELIQKGVALANEQSENGDKK